MAQSSPNASSHSGPVKKKKQHHSQSSHSGPVKKKKHNPGSSPIPGPGGPGPGGPGPGGGSSSSGGSARVKPEEGDYIINWHLQYCANIFLQYESTLRSLQDQIKAELMKIKTDGDFIKNLLPGPHQHLARLKSEDRDLRSALDPINTLNDLFRLIAHRSAERII